MSKPHVVKFHLTDYQLECLKPLFLEAEINSNENKKGLIVAKIEEIGESGFVFVPDPYALKLQEIINEWWKSFED